MAEEHQPVGVRLAGWSPPSRPLRGALSGRVCRLEPLDAAVYADGLFAANSIDTAGRMWTYLPYGPFSTAIDYRTWMEHAAKGEDPLMFAIVDNASGRPLGVAAYLRADPPNGVIEIGHLAFSPELQRTAAATEALYVMLRHVFELGYRRCEWKCNALNAPSRVAAERLGFTFEGIFRQAAVVKGCNRDTAWFSIIDTEWPERRAAFERWLSLDNFDAQGRQRRSLVECRA
jgi:RimJ/RimL family protein N-acetyltransferase